MGKDIEICVEKRSRAKDATWENCGHFSFVDRHHGVFDDLDERATLLARGEPIGKATLHLMHEAYGKGLGPWERGDRDDGVRMVTAVDYLEILLKWAAPHLGPGNALASKELLEVGCMVLMSRARGCPDEHYLRIIYWPDEFVLTNQKQLDERWRFARSERGRYGDFS